MSEQRYVMVKDSWGLDPRFVKGFEFTEGEVPEEYQFERGLAKGTFVPIEEPATDEEIEVALAEISAEDTSKKDSGKAKKFK